jgi:putative ABC transport system permease protein
MDDRLRDSVARQRFSTTMLGALTAFALLLAAVGVYGVISYLVSQSTHDIGVRIALGAGTRDIVGLVVRQGMELAAIGIAAGVIGALVLTRLMASLLFGVTATDAITFSAVVVILAAVAFSATLIPARRATATDLMVALREE